MREKLKAGETARYQCNDCDTEFEVCLEPKATGMKPESRPKETARVDVCPFCASDDLEDL